MLFLTALELSHNEFSAVHLLHQLLPPHINPLVYLPYLTKNKITVYPRFCQTQINTIVGNAQCRSAINTGGFSIPTFFRKLITGPLFENNASHTAEIATMFTIYGRYKPNCTIFLPYYVLIQHICNDE